MITGVSELIGALERTARQVDAATRRATSIGAHALEKEIKKELSTGSHRKGTPTLSNPGDPPDLVTGTLRRSVKVTGPLRVGRGRWEAQIGPTAVYGRIQELGGVTGRDGATVLPARPYVRPAYEWALDTGQLARTYREAWLATIARSR